MESLSYPLAAHFCGFITVSPYSMNLSPHSMNLLLVMKERYFYDIQMAIQRTLRNSSALSKSLEKGE